MDKVETISINVPESYQNKFRLELGDSGFIPNTSVDFHIESIDKNISYIFSIEMGESDCFFVITKMENSQPVMYSKLICGYGFTVFDNKVFEIIAE